MQYTFKYGYIYILCLFISSIGYAQVAPLTNDALLEKLASYSKTNPSNLLFVHTDKTLYTNNETIWFSAYLLRSESTGPGSHTILSAALVREDNRNVQLQSKYLMQDGLSFGSLTLPDSIPPGNYQLIASTNVLDEAGMPIAVFSQPVTIKSITQQNFNASLILLDTLLTNGMVRAKLTVNITVPVGKEKISVDYRVGKGISRSVALNENSYIIAIPEEELSQAQPMLMTSIRYNNQVQHLNIRLPHPLAKGIHVRFFPEGGNLTDGLLSTIAWEAKTSGGLPIPVRGILYKNNLPVDTLNTNSYGIGRFDLKADRNSNYKLKLSDQHDLERDTLYTLPEATQDGIVIQLQEAVVNDTLHMVIYSHTAKTVRVLVHDYRDPYASFTIKAQPQGIRASIALQAIPKGLKTITVLDEQGRPLAERIFFAHYDQRVNAVIKTGKNSYSRKDSVHLSLRLTDPAGKPLRGIVSIAVVQDNRIEGSKQRDIESYVYLDDPLGSLPRDPAGRGILNKQYLEDILLVKGWRRYTWMDLTDTNAKDLITHHTQPAAITGKVFFRNKPLNKPVEINILRDTRFDVITSGNDGSFVLDMDKLIITEGSSIVLNVNGKNSDDYTFKFQDPYQAMNDSIARHISIPPSGLVKLKANSNDQVLDGMQRMIALQPVTITANRNDGRLFGTKRGPNKCGDYVCVADILNCPFHAADFYNRPPIIGEEYKVYTGSKFMSKTTYLGCQTNKSLFTVNGIYLSREFYGVNDNPDYLSEPQFVSTLFWRPGEIISPEGNNLSFVAGDITGPFRVVVQGLAGTDVLFGEGSFVVK